MLRAALYVARSRDDALMDKAARRLLARLADDRFRLAVVGEVSRGKSTLMNAILGAAYLPTGVLPVTSVITTVRYGSRPRALARRRGAAHALEVPVDEVAGFIAQSGAQRSELRVLSVDIEVPAEVLRLGFEFVDTPGVGPAAGIGGATTKRFLPQADAVIVVTAFDSPLTATETELLIAAKRQAGRVFLVVNKRDLVSSGAAADVLDSLGRQLHDGAAPNRSESRLFALSALQGLQAREQGDGRRLVDSGLPPFENALLEFLAAEKARLSLDNVASRAETLVRALRLDLSLGRLAAHGDADSAAVEAAFDARMADLEAQRRAVTAAVADRVRAEAPSLLAARGPHWRAQLQEKLSSSVDTALGAAADKPGTGDLLGFAAVQLNSTGRQIAADWLGHRGGEVNELLLGLVANEIETLSQLSRLPLVLGMEIVGLAAAEDRSESIGWSLEDIPAVAVPRVGWSVSVRSERWSRDRSARRDAKVRQHLLNALDTAITAFESRAERAFRDAADSWVRLLADETERRTRQTAERFRYNLRTPPHVDDLAVLDELVSRLADYRADLRVWRSGAGSHDPVTAAPGSTAGSGKPVRAAQTCVVCQRMAATLAGYLAHEQLRLATREHEQARHAAAGGFCPLHTWQFAGMASPVGVSAGSARLAECTADMLDALDRRSSTVDQLAVGAATLITRVQHCPICAVLAESERDALADAVAEPAADGAMPTLCLHHLAMALPSAPTLERGREMLGALAAALRRDSEDMRSYALKREALRPVSDAESHAHQRALRLLSGQKALVAALVSPSE